MINSSRPAALSAEDIESAVLAAGRAPSVHNTQPWRIRVRRGDLYLSADPDRRLPAADPAGREMVISCGAALYDLILALRHLGHRPTMQLLPDPDFPHRLAVVHPAAGPAPADGDDRRYAAIAHRRTHRGGFTPEPVPAALLHQIRVAARAENIELVVFHEEADVRVLATVTELASYMHIRDRAYAAEHARWMRSADSAQADGIHPAHLAEAVSRTDPHFPARFVDVTKPPRRDGERPVGTVVLLTTAGDDKRHWLYAGMALQRILLELTAADHTAALHTQPMEIPHLRSFVADEFAGGRHPQMLMRIGRPITPVPGAPSARRPVADILSWTDPA